MRRVVSTILILLLLCPTVLLAGDYEKGLGAVTDQQTL